METLQEQKNIQWMFRLSVLLKGIISAAEVVAGIVAFFVPITAVTDIFIEFAESELAETPSSFVANHLLTLAQDASTVTPLFLGVYLLSRGLIKLVLVWALLKNRLWAYPSALIVLGLFVAFQLYGIATGASILIAILTLFDLVVMYFIWREYRIVLARQKK